MDHMADLQQYSMVDHGVYGIVFWAVISFIVIVLIKEMVSHK